LPRAFISLPSAGNTGFLRFWIMQEFDGCFCHFMGSINNGFKRKNDFKQTTNIK
jgi:hypothetical protein